MHSSAKSNARTAGEGTQAKEPLEEITLPEIRLITQAERDSLQQMAAEISALVGAKLEPPKREG